MALPLSLSGFMVWMFKLQFSGESEENDQRGFLKKAPLDSPKTFKKKIPIHQYLFESSWDS